MNDYDRVMLKMFMRIVLDALLILIRALAQHPRFEVPIDTWAKNRNLFIDSYDLEFRE